MITRLDHIILDEETTSLKNKIKASFFHLEIMLNKDLQLPPELESQFRTCPELHNATTKLEECWMWVCERLKVIQSLRDEKYSAEEEIKLHKSLLEDLEKKENKVLENLEA